LCFCTIFSVRLINCNCFLVLLTVLFYQRFFLTPILVPVGYTDLSGSLLAVYRENAGCVEPARVHDCAGPDILQLFPVLRGRHPRRRSRNLANRAGFFQAHVPQAADPLQIYLCSITKFNSKIYSLVGI
jgi:hypothetical protein